MQDYVKVGNLQVAPVLYEFINKQAVPDSGISSDDFWAGLEAILHHLAPKNKQLLQMRDEMQEKIDDWHHSHDLSNKDVYTLFLKELGYIEPEVRDYSISTENIDEEISRQAGPGSWSFLLTTPVMPLMPPTPAGGVCMMPFMGQM